MAKKTPKPSDKSTFDLMMAWEGGNMTVKEYMTLFSRLVKSGQAWTLQGMYGREAMRMIERGMLDKKGNILWKNIATDDLNTMIYDE